LALTLKPNFASDLAGLIARISKLSGESQPHGNLPGIWMLLKKRKVTVDTKLLFCDKPVHDHSRRNRNGYLDGCTFHLEPMMKVTNRINLRATVLCQRMGLHQFPAGWRDLSGAVRGSGVAIKTAHIHFK
jgi:hypothetical protein